MINAAIISEKMMMGTTDVLKMNITNTGNDNPAIIDPRDTYLNINNISTKIPKEISVGQK